MTKRTKKSQIEDNTLSVDEEGDKTLTSDLPSRNRKKKGGWRFGKLVPALIIVLAGVLGFLIPTLQRTDDSGPKSFSSANNNTNTVPVEQPEPVIVYEDVKFATVTPNSVGFLNVRSEATAGSTKLGQLDIGDKLEVLAESAGWVKVKLSETMSDETEGWVSAEYISVSVEQVRVE